MKRRLEGSPELRSFRLLLLLLATLAPGCSDHAGQDRPDIVLFVVDTLRADHLPIYGYGRDTSPNLSELAERGLVFDRAYSHSGWTLPAMGSLLTGLYPSEHGLVRDPEGVGLFGGLESDVSTLASLLEDRGYRTAAFVNNVFLSPDFGFDRGFDFYDWKGASASEIRSAQDTVAAALAWLESAKTPAFVLIHVMEPHLPYDPPPAARGRFAPLENLPVPVPFYARRHFGLLSSPEPAPPQLAAIQSLYDEEILATDLALGRLAQEFFARRPDAPGWLWITADHGEEFWDHGAFEHGHQLFGELIRVPLVAVGPVTRPRRIGAPVQHADVFRTLVELGGGSAPSGTHGATLLDDPLDPATFVDQRPILSEDCLYGPPRVVLTSGRQRLLVNLLDREPALYLLDENGQSDREALASEARASQTDLIRRLVDLRGSLDATPIVRSAARMDLENIRALRSLGYIQ